MEDTRFKVKLRVEKINSFEEKDEENFEFNQDFNTEDEFRSPGWIRYQKRIK